MDAETQQLFNCGHISLAARRLGFKIMKHHKDGEFAFAWVDLMNNMSAYLCPSGKTEIEALTNACNLLSDYLSCPPSQTQKPESPSSS